MPTRLAGAGARVIGDDEGMPTYLAFLRAINLGANRRFPKDDIRRAVESLGFTDVATHINTGNVRFATSMRSRAKIEAALEQAFADDRGFEVPTIVFTTAEFAQIAWDAEELGAQHPDAERHYVYLMKEEPSAEARAEIEGRAGEAGEMVIRGRAAHALLGPGYRTGQVDALHAEKLLGVATNRNATQIAAIAGKWT